MQEKEIMERIEKLERQVTGLVGICQNLLKINDETYESMSNLNKCILALDEKNKKKRKWF